MFTSKTLPTSQTPLFFGAKMKEIAKRRGWHDIITEILKTARDGEIKTHIMFKAGLSHNQVNRYLSFLVEKGLVENLTVKRKKSNTRLYRTTQKGVQLIEILESLRKLEGSPVVKHKSKEFNLALT